MTDQRPIDLDALERLHDRGLAYQDGSYRCGECGESWPCSTIALITAVRAAMIVTENFPLRANTTAQDEMLTMLDDALEPFFAAITKGGDE